MKFESLYQGYQRRLYGWATRRTHGVADAEDLVQDAFLAMHLSLPRYRREGELDAWVFGVARNVWRVQLRANARMKRRAPLVPLDEVAASELVERRTAFDALAAERALRDAETRGRDAVGDAQWDELVDYSLERTDLDALETATGLSRDALKSRISRARRRVSEACPDLAG
ncbi:MAG TPA: sigma-70 family RNA polymerase sigma factor [Myxococcota bacterium]|nr:sigma-70 family RNA polymerase sigma factor [Myxococcota bacterium]